MRYHYTPTRITKSNIQAILRVCKDVEPLEVSNSTVWVGESVGTIILQNCLAVSAKVNTNLFCNSNSTPGHLPIHMNAYSLHQSHEQECS